MSTTTRSAVAAAALTLSVSPLLLTPTASAEPVGVADAAVSSSERDVGARTARELELELYLDRLDAAAREAAERRRSGDLTGRPGPHRRRRRARVRRHAADARRAGRRGRCDDRPRRVHVPGRRPVAA